MFFTGVAAALALASVSACRDQGGTFTPRVDSGVETLTCNTTADCNGRGICMSGVCEAVTTCQSDSDCTAEGKVCHSRRSYCVQCDGTHPNECPEGQTCQFDFTCVSIGGGRADGGDNDAGACSGSCTDRTMCGADQVCTNGACCPPPARCFSPADCPANRPECNGATGQCFGGDSCVADGDCNTQPGCGGGACICSNGSCRARPDECQGDADCLSNGQYDGRFCLLTSPPKRCVNAPGCASDADCVQSSLVCDLTPGSPSINKCKNGTPCPNGNECNATTEICQNGVCLRKNCLNSPELCNATQVCDATTGMCVANSAGSCTSDADCAADRYCNTLSSPALCTLGCRDSSSCPNGQICNAAHQCEGGSGTECGTCTTDADCPAGTACLEGLTGSKCYEQCSMILNQPCTIRTDATCIFGRCACGI
ncbi:hypothetical protein L6R52_20880 [Myxococcota bacterium]|nr:hypothetical protein [Myxococcota bacterium]